MQTIGLIWAQGRNRELGANGRMPWHIPEDLSHFARTTAACPVIMGRHTWESLPAKNRPLPGRTNIVLSRKNGWSAPGTQIASSLLDGIELASRTASETESSAALWIIGGARVYQEALDAGLADIVCLTEIDAAFPEADTFAPEFRSGGTWIRANETPWLTSETGLRYRFLTYRRA